MNCANMFLQISSLDLCGLSSYNYLLMSDILDSYLEEATQDASLDVFTVNVNEIEDNIRVKLTKI